MTFNIEHVRTKYNKIWRDDVDPTKRMIEQRAGVAVHYESVLDSGVYDTEIDVSPQRINNVQLDGWRVTANGWHFALGQPGNKATDGWIGFGGRQGAHWLLFRLLQVGYIHWATRSLEDLGGNPNYNRANLSQSTISLDVGPNGETQNLSSIATWSSVFTGVDIRWRVDGQRLKEEVILSQAAREALPNPSTPAPQTYFGFVFQLDVSDIPKWLKNNVLQNLDDVDDSDGDFQLRDASDNALAFMPIDYAYSEEDANGIRQRVRLTKRIYSQNGNHFLIIGAPVQELNSLPAGAITFDPTIDDQVGASGDDGAYNTGCTAFDATAAAVVVSSTGDAGWQLFDITGATGTIDVSYCEVYKTSANTTNVRIWAEDAANPSVPASCADVNGRTKTTNSVVWALDTAKNTWDTSPSLNTIFQELVDSYTVGNCLALIEWESAIAQNSAHYRNYDGGSTQAPKLHIEYTVAGGSLPIFQNKQQLLSKRRF